MMVLAAKKSQSEEFVMFFCAAMRQLARGPSMRGKELVACENFEVRDFCIYVCTGDYHSRKGGAFFLYLCMRR